MTSTGDNSFTGPVEGVEFTVFPLLKEGAPVNLTVPASWQGISALTPGANCTAPAGYTLGSGIVMPETDSAGLATISLDQTLYMVCETGAPVTIVDRAAAFILTIPMPFENGWVYDVHAFPKNGESSVVKTIDPDHDLGLGSIVTFPVSVGIPVMTNAWTGFAVRDAFDARLLPSDGGVFSVQIDDVDVDASYYTVDTAGQVVTMNFTAAGLDWLNTGAGANTTIVVTFAGVVDSIGDGVVTNNAEGWFNNPGFDPSVTPPIPSNEVTTNWGDLVLKKFAAGTADDTGLLNGAEFEVYAAADPYAADCSSATPAQPEVALSVKGATTFTSVDGIVNIAGLFVSDSENAPMNAETRCYVVKETVAPAGYTLPANPYSPVTITIGATTGVDIEIANTQQEVPELPLTGAAGQVILITAGVATLGLVVGLVLLNRRRATSGR